MGRLLALLACLLLATSCDAFVTPAPSPTDAPTDTTLVTSMPSDPDTIDPQRVAFTQEAAIVGMLYEPLLSWDPSTLALVPAAAAALPSVSADGLVYTYTLRDGLTYSDGSPLTAQRFVDAFARLCDPTIASEYAFVAYPIVGCQTYNELDPKKSSGAELDAARGALGLRALDAAHVEFRLSQPLPVFPQATALWVGAPIRLEDLEAAPQPGSLTRTLARYIGNGPFVLGEWTKGQRMVFNRNSHYRLPVRLARWTKLILPSTTAQDIDRGLVDVTRIGPSSATNRAALLARPDLKRTSANCTISIGFNTARPPFDDANVRLAFAKAVDRDAYASDVALTGRGATTFVPPGVLGHSNDDQVQAFDPGQARQLLAASHYGRPVDGVLGGAPITWTFLATPGMQQRLSWIADQWSANLGVNVALQAIPPGSGGPLVKKPEQVPALQYMGWCGDYPDAQEWYTIVFGSSSAVQHTRYFDPAFDTLAARADGERDPAARQRDYETTSYLLSREAPAMWLIWTEQWFLVRPDVSGYTLSPFDWDFSQFTLAKIVGVRH